MPKLIGTTKVPEVLFDHEKGARIIKPTNKSRPGGFLKVIPRGKMTGSSKGAAPAIPYRNLRSFMNERQGRLMREIFEEVGRKKRVY